MCTRDPWGGMLHVGFLALRAKRASERARERERGRQEETPDVEEERPCRRRPKTVQTNWNRKKSARWRAKATSAASLFFRINGCFPSIRSPWRERGIDRRSSKQPPRPIKRKSVIGRSATFCLFSVGVFAAWSLLSRPLAALFLILPRAQSTRGFLEITLSWLKRQKRT